MTSTAPHQALYRRWRAQTFDQMVGQEAVVETLRNAVRTGRVSHAILFVGPRGTGKTSLARIVAKAVNCTDLQDGDPCDRCDACVAIRENTTLDVLEIDAASNRGINEVRELRERLAYPPGHLRQKVYILDEAHQITKDAWNALLKSLEEPPEYVTFLFASTEPAGFPPAILSRLQRYDVRRLTIPEIEGKLLRILEADGRTVEPAALTLIARLAAGGMRDAESILDQLLSTNTDLVTEQDVRELLGLADSTAVDGFIDALLRGDPSAGIAILDRLEDRGRDPRALLDQVVESIRMRLTHPDAGGADRTIEATPEAYAAVARRLVAIDPDRAGIGGLRLQLELALFADPTAVPHDVSPQSIPGGAAPNQVTAAPDRAAAPEPTERRPTERQPVEPVIVEPVVAEPVIADAPAPAPTTPAEEAGESPAIPAADVAAATTRSAASDPTATAVAASDATAELTLDRIVAAWPEIVTRLSQKPAIKQLIVTCRPVALDGVIVSLGFPEEQAFLRDVAERKKAAIESGVAEVIGRDVGIRCVVANIEVTAADAPDDGYLLSEARRIFGEDLVDVGEIG